MSRLLVTAWRRLVSRGGRVESTRSDVVVGPVPPGGPDQYAHPAWCDQGAWCRPPTTARDGTIEWSQWAALPVEGGHHTARVWLVRMEDLTPEGWHNVEESVQVDADGPFDGDQLEGLAIALLQAARALRAGLPGTPGGIPAVLRALPEPRPAPGRNRAI
jgi:hypothetical protein